MSLAGIMVRSTTSSGRYPLFTCATYASHPVVWFLRKSQAMEAFRKEHAFSSMEEYEVYLEKQGPQTLAEVHEAQESMREAKKTGQGIQYKR